jgi:hypothetical protein
MLQVPIPGLDATKLAGVQVEVCLDDACFSGQLDEHVGNELRLGRYPDALILVRTDVYDGNLVVNAQYRSEDLEHFRDGDVYSMRVIGADSVELTARAWSAKYQTLQPNGPDCGPTCRIASLQALE